MKFFTIAAAILLCCSFMATSQVFGKKKSKEETTDVISDSLTKANQALTLKADSLSVELAKYFGVYTVIKEKVIHYDFDPAKMSFLIDSLKTSRDSAFVDLTSKSGVVLDSMTLLKNEIRVLRATIDSVSARGSERLAALTTEEIEKAKAVTNLKQLKELLDAKIITETEFNAAKRKYIDKL
jgi:hypothetical protein